MQHCSNFYPCLCEEHHKGFKSVVASSYEDKYIQADDTNHVVFTANCKLYSSSNVDIFLPAWCPLDGRYSIGTPS